MATSSYPNTWDPYIQRYGSGVLIQPGSPQQTPQLQIIQPGQAPAFQPQTPQDVQPGIQPRIHEVPTQAIPAQPEAPQPPAVYKQMPQPQSGSQPQLQPAPQQSAQPQIIIQQQAAPRQSAGQPQQDATQIAPQPQTQAVPQPEGPGVIIVAPQSAAQQETATLQEVPALTPAQQKATEISIGWIIFALFLAGCVLFFGIRRISSMRGREEEPTYEEPTFGPNDLKLLDLAKAVATIQGKTQPEAEGAGQAASSGDEKPEESAKPE